MENNKTIFDSLCERFPNGIEYSDAIQVCLGLYVVDKLLPEVKQEMCTKEDISDSFQQLARVGKILNYSSRNAVLYGAHFHDYEDKGHWIEIIVSIFKKGVAIDHERLSEIGIEVGGGGTPAT